MLSYIHLCLIIHIYSYLLLHLSMCPFQVLFNYRFLSLCNCAWLVTQLGHTLMYTTAFFLVHLLNCKHFVTFLHLYIRTKYSSTIEQNTEHLVHNRHHLLVHRMALHKLILWSRNEHFCNKAIN